MAKHRISPTAARSGNELSKAAENLFGELSDDVRRAAEISAERALSPREVREACRYGFDQVGLHRIYAYVLGINPAGRRAFERAGFTIEGTLRDDRWAVDRFIDSYLLARVNT